MPKIAKARIQTAVVASSGNVFADLGLPHAKDKQTKISLAVQLNRLIDNSGMSQAAIARLLRLEMSELLALAKYRLEKFGVERLKSLLAALNDSD